MLTKNEAGKWIVTIGRNAGKLLSEVVQHDSYWLIEWAMPSCDYPEDIAVVNAALKEREDAVNAIERVPPLAELKGEALLREMDEAIPIRR